MNVTLADMKAASARASALRDQLGSIMDNFVPPPPRRSLIAVVRSLLKS